MSAYSCDDIEYIKLIIYSFQNRTSISSNDLFSYVKEIKDIQRKTKSRECSLLVREAMNYRHEISRKISEHSKGIFNFYRSMRPSDNKGDKRFDSHVKKLASGFNELSNQINKKIEHYKANVSCS